MESHLADRACYTFALPFHVEEELQAVAVSPITKASSPEDIRCQRRRPANPRHLQLSISRILELTVATAPSLLSLG